MLIVEMFEFGNHQKYKHESSWFADFLLCLRCKKNGDNCETVSPDDIMLRPESHNVWIDSEVTPQSQRYPMIQSDDA